MHRALCLALAVWPTALMAEPLFPNSVVSNDIDFISDSDPSAFYCLTYFGTAQKEMPDKRGGDLFADGVYEFEAWFTDGTAVGIWVHPDLGSMGAAEEVAEQVTGPLGRLPSFMREVLNHVVIHKGDETAFAEDLGHFFVLYDGNMKKRLATRDLEETVFHEAVHATLDHEIANGDLWLGAQLADGTFVTDYAAANPTQEDLAETALFALTYFRHPERLPDNMPDTLEALIPNRLALLDQLFGPDQILQREADDLEDCP
ncbi:MAG: hypothetical protein AAF718_16635 [Pseudomonadota bacterium]